MRLALIWAGVSVLASFIGAERCKLCHRDVYESWRATPHSRASLDPGRELDAETELRCLACHGTGNDRLSGVQCEACHGAGSDYAPPEVMIDPDKAAMAGLVRPSEATCRRCHGSDEPAHRRDFEMPEGVRWAETVHVRARP